MLFANTRVDRKNVDVQVLDGRITRVESPGQITALPSDEVVHGGRLTPHMAEPHVHLDAALLGASTPNRSGTLREGIANWARLRPALTEEDVRDRATQTAMMYAKTGTTRIRTHVDTGSLLAVRTLIDLRGELKKRGITLEVVAFPQEGILRSPSRRALWEEAVAMGVDCVGAIPHFERTTEEGWESVRLAFDLAEKHGCKLDFHCDESDDPHSRNLEVVCAQTIDRGLHGKVVAGHCTALHSYNHPYAEKLMELVAEAGVQVIANPLDNVVLQGRYDRYPRRRGITRVDELWRAGATVGIGHDSVQDPWYRFGTARMIDAAYMLVHVAQLTGEDELERVLTTLWQENHLPFGETPSIAVGEPAHVLWWPVQDAADFFVHRPDPRVFP